MNPDPVAAQIAQLDQLECEAPNLARMYRIVFMAMRAKGFDESQALTLTMFAIQQGSQHQ